MKYFCTAQFVFTSLVIIFVIIDCTLHVEALECTRRRNGLLHAPFERFFCPGFGDKRKAFYCCGNELNRYCCPRSQAYQHSLRHNGARGALYFGLVVLLVIGGCIVGCCLCCYWMIKRRKGTRGAVLATNNDATIGGQSVHMVNQPPPSSYPTIYPNQQAYGTPMYPPPPQPGFAAYPPYATSADNPPTYYSSTNAPPVDTKLPPFNPNYPQ